MFVHPYYVMFSISWFTTQEEIPEIEDGRYHAPHTVYGLPWIKNKQTKSQKKKKKNCGTLLPWLLNMFLTAIKENHAYPKSQNGQNSQTEEQSTAKKVRSIKEKTKKKIALVRLGSVMLWE